MKRTDGEMERQSKTDRSKRKHSMNRGKHSTDERTRKQSKRMDGSKHSMDGSTCSMADRPTKENSKSKAGKHNRETGPRTNKQMEMDTHSKRRRGGRE